MEANSGKSNGSAHINGLSPDTRIVLQQDLTDNVAIIGSGNFGLALAKKMTNSNIKVYIGSRHKAKIVKGFQTVSIAEAFKSSQIIILAVPFQFIDGIPLEKLSAGQIVIDSTNRVKACRKDQESQAEIIRRKLPEGIDIVKCFNTLSAYEIENSINSQKEILLASDSTVAMQQVAELIHKMGYNPNHLGGLQLARNIENIPLSFFKAWHAPLFISTLLWLLFFLLRFGRAYLCRDNTLGWFPDGVDPIYPYNPFSLTSILLTDLIKAFDGQALTLLAACYLPGVIAAYTQLLRGTKFSDFPAWLNHWMVMRKQLGLLMLFSASIHACYYCLLYNDAGFTTTLPWNHQAFLSAGVLGFAMAVILGLTSLPSISASLSWREFRAVQSILGWTCLILSTLHCLLNAMYPPELGKTYNLFTWSNCVFFSDEQAGLLLPAITIGLKIPLLLPWCDSRLTKIRRGEVFRLTEGWLGIRVFGIDIIG